MVPIVRRTAAELLRLIAGILKASGVSAPKARLMAESLVAASLRGVDSHGIRLLPFYLKQIKAGNIDPDADGHVVSRSGACLLYSGEHGLGQWTAATCSDLAVQLAREHGLGMIVARESNHFGAAAFWAQRISTAGMIGLVMTNSSPSVPPWQGKEGRLGTNPICLSIPSSGPGSWLLDMATTTVAKNKILMAAAAGVETLPTGWAMDSEGIPTQDTKCALDGLLMPLGGYKGSGLAMMVEVLCAVLGGGPMSTDVGGLYITDRRMNVSQMYMAIDVARFLPVSEFQLRMEQLVSNIKSSRSAQGFEEVLVAGDPEDRAQALRSREGIPLELPQWEELTMTAESLGVPIP